MAVTGLEASDMDTWWERNKPKFDSYDMFFGDVACITATREKFKNDGYIYQTEYEASTRKVEDLIQHLIGEPQLEMFLGPHCMNACLRP